MAINKSLSTPNKTTSLVKALNKMHCEAQKMEKRYSVDTEGYEENYRLEVDSIKAGFHEDYIKKEEGKVSTEKNVSTLLKEV